MNFNCIKQFHYTSLPCVSEERLLSYELGLAAGCALVDAVTLLDECLMFQLFLLQGRATQDLHERLPAGLTPDHVHNHPLGPTKGNPWLSAWLL